jgi:hypothetical protein
MKYLMLIAVDGSSRPADRAAGEKLMAEYQTFTEGITGSGELVAADRLAGAEAATCVRVRDGKTVLTDGPFAETTEQLGGFYIVEVPDLDRALQLAAQIPNARDGVVEVRPIAAG